MLSCQTTCLQATAASTAVLLMLPPLLVLMPLLPGLLLQALEVLTVLLAWALAL